MHYYICTSIWSLDYSTTLQINKKLWQKRGRKVSSEFIVDQTLIRVGRGLVWLLWIVIESIEKIILDMRISIERGIYLLLQNGFFKN